MEPPTHHLAQVNIGRMRAPLDTPVMADFMAQLDQINGYMLIMTAVLECLRTEAMIGFSAASLASL